MKGIWGMLSTCVTLLVFCNPAVASETDEEICPGLLQSHNITFKPDLYKIQFISIPEPCKETKLVRETVQDEKGKWGTVMVEKCVETLKFPGSVTIFGQSLIPTNRLILAADQLKINKTAVMIVSENGIEQPVDILNTSHESGLLVITLKRELSPVDKIQINVEYYAEDCGEWDGCGFGTFGLRKITEIGKFDKIIGIGAKRVFPHFDKVPSMYEMTVIREENQTTLFNTQLEKTKAHSTGNGWHIDTFVKTPRLFPEKLHFTILSDHYTFAEQVGNDNGKPIRVRLYGRKNLLNKHDARVKTFLNNAISVIPFFRDFYGDHDSLVKMDFVETQQNSDNPSYSWGIATNVKPPQENWKLQAGFDAVANKKLELAQNLARIWLGEIKRPVDLNKALQSYLSELAIKSLENENEGKWADYELIIGLERSVAHFPSVGIGSNPYRVRRLRGVLKMYEDFFTPEIVTTAVKTYTMKLWKCNINGNMDKFLEYLHEAAGNNRKLSSPSEMGSMFGDGVYPIVKLETLNSSHVALSQEKFVVENNSSKIKTGVFHVPVKILKETEAGVFSTVNVWLGPNQPVILEHDGTRLIMVDPNATGVYRVQLDKNTLDNIHKQLKINPKIFNPMYRKMLLDDYVDFYKNKYVRLPAVLNLTRYMDKEVEFRVWETFSFNLFPIYDRVEQYPEKVLFQKYVAKLIEPHLNWNHGDKQLHLQANQLILTQKQSLDTKITRWFDLWRWACSTPTRVCEQYVRSLLERWKDDPSQNPFKAEAENKFFRYRKAHDAVKCKLIQVGGEDAVQFAMDIYEDEWDTSLLQSLGCSTDSSLILELFNKSLVDSNWHNSQDGFKVLLGLVFNSPIVKSRFLDFMSVNSTWFFDKLIQQDKDTRHRNSLSQDFANFAAANSKQILPLISEYVERENEKNPPCPEPTYGNSASSYGFAAPPAPIVPPRAPIGIAPTPTRRARATVEYGYGPQTDYDPPGIEAPSGIAPTPIRIADLPIKGGYDTPGFDASIQNFPTPIKIADLPKNGGYGPPTNYAPPGIEAPPGIDGPIMSDQKKCCSFPTCESKGEWFQYPLKLINETISWMEENGKDLSTWLNMQQL